MARAAPCLFGTSPAGWTSIAIPDRPAPAAVALLDLMEHLPSVEQVIGRDAASVRVRLYDGVEVRLHLCEVSAWGAALL